MRSSIDDRKVLALLAWLIPALVAAEEPVTVRPFSDVAVSLERQAAAQVESMNEAVLAAEVNARVLEILVRPGQTVRRGESLLRLDDEGFVIQHEAASARLELADAALDMARLRAERARQAPDTPDSDDELVEAETRLRQAQAERRVAEYDLASADLVLARTEIRAPFAGVVQARLIGVGTMAQFGTPLIELVSLDDIEISAAIAPGLTAGLERARLIEFVSRDRAWPVTVARIAPVIDQVSGTREARLVFVDASAPPGSDGRIRWTDPQPALPADYIVQREGRLGVLVLDEDGRTVRFIELAAADAGRPLAVDLPGDTLLIDEGRRRVQPGEHVRVN